MRRRTFIASAATLPFATWAHAATPELPEINRLIVKAVLMLKEKRDGGGYGGPGEREMSHAFTQNLAYPLSDAIPQHPRNEKRHKDYKRATMCVAGVAEVMIEALNYYAQEDARKTDNINVYEKLPVSMWTGSRLQDLRPYLWVQEDSRNVFKYTDADTPKIVHKDGTVRHAVSRGSAHAFRTLKMGEELPFSALRQGDFINLNRSKSGHSVIFWKYIDKNNRYSDEYSPDVIGFQYFSAQSPKIGGGFDFRDGYFGDHAGPSAGGIKDTGIRRQSSQLILNSGRLWTPAKWKIREARDDIQRLAYSRTSGSRAVRGAATERILNDDLGPSVVDFSDSGEV